MSNAVSKDVEQNISSMFPLESLAILHTITNPKDIIPNKEFADILENNMPLSPSSEIIGPLFNGTLYFVHITFTTPNGTFSISDEDAQTIINYSKRAIMPISKYCLQYGPNSLKVSDRMIKHSVNLDTNIFSTPQLEKIVNDIVETNNLPKDSSTCIVILNNKQGPKCREHLNALGWHEAAEPNDIPYCFCHIRGQNMTIEDSQNHYAQVVSHEIAEMTVDPLTRERNPEVCDACAPNCGVNFFSFFDNDDNYLDTRQDLNQPDYAYFINSICRRDLYDPTNQCAIGHVPGQTNHRDEMACKYAMPNP